MKAEKLNKDSKERRKLRKQGGKIVKK